MSSTILGQMALECIRKQTESAMWSKSVSSISHSSTPFASCSCLQVPALTSLHNRLVIICKMSKSITFQVVFGQGVYYNNRNLTKTLSNAHGSKLQLALCQIGQLKRL